MRKIIAGNWKMNGSTASITSLISELLSVGDFEETAELIVFPPSPYLQLTKSLFSRVNWYIGAQDISPHADGAYTGDISASMLRDLGCSHVLVGHSERRQYHKESNELVAQKYSKALSHKLLPILCVGETLEQREDGLATDIIDKQLQSVLDLPSGNDLLDKGIIAYEPVWAIGTGVAATVDDAKEIHQHIKSKLADLSIKDVPVIYGGSVNPQNAESILNCSVIDGVLVGGASLDATKFMEIVKCTK